MPGNFAAGVDAMTRGGGVRGGDEKAGGTDAEDCSGCMTHRRHGAP
jgi:hypothetical protein